MKLRRPRRMWAVYDRQNDRLRWYWTLRRALDEYNWERVCGHRPILGHVVDKDKK